MIDGMSHGSTEGRAFTSRVLALRAAGARYQDLADRSYDARSTAWFNNLVNSHDPWAVSPPSPGAWPGLSQLLGVTEPRLCEMIAEEWFAVSATDVPSRVRDLVALLSPLSDGDLDLLRGLVERLGQARTTIGAPDPVAT